MVPLGDLMDIRLLFISNGKEIIWAVSHVVGLKRFFPWIFVDANMLLWIAPDQHWRQHLHLFTHGNRRPQN